MYLHVYKHYSRNASNYRTQKLDDRKIFSNLRLFPSSVVILQQKKLEIRQKFRPKSGLPIQITSSLQIKFSNTVTAFPKGNQFIPNPQYRRPFATKRIQKIVPLSTLNYK